MIEYTYEEEKIVALFFADTLNDALAKEILQNDEVKSRDEAIHLSQFFWSMANRSADNNIQLPCDGDSQYWTEKLYNSIGGYLEDAGYEEQWNAEINNT